MSKYTKYLTKGSIDSDLALEIQDWTDKHPKDHFKLEVSAIKSIRSDAQRRYLWGVLYPAFIEHAPALDNKQIDYSDWSKDDWHQALAETYLRRYSEKTQRETTRSTESLTLEEYSKYINDCIGMLCKLGGSVPECEEYRIAMGVKK